MCIPLQGHTKGFEGGQAVGVSMGGATNAEQHYKAKHGVNALTEISCISSPSLISMATL